MRQAVLSPQRRAFAESGAANATSHYDPSRENGIAERPQALRYPEIINILSTIYAQSNAERIQNRPPKHTTARRRGQNCTGRSCVKRRIALSCVGSIGECQDKREYLKREYQFFRRPLPALKWACRCGTAAGTPPCTWQAGQSAAGRRRGRRRISSTRSR